MREKPRTRAPRARSAVTAAICLVAGLGGCHLEGRSRRVEQLLAELSPRVHLGESLSDARRAIPALGVRHPGDSLDRYVATGRGSPTTVAVVVWPRPALGEHASPDALVEAVELVMSPEVANRLRAHMTDVFGAPVRSTCARPTLAETDRVVEWQIGGRGGALLTLPERRPNGVVPTARLFIFTS